MKVCLKKKEKVKKKKRKSKSHDESVEFFCEIIEFTFEFIIELIFD
ncbi:MAG: hypothetical protein J6B74_00515 [Ruminococcus sp.]|nr:hypothetical protein [Ruminococcus sp.]